MKSHLEAGTGTHTDPLKPSPQRVEEDASEMELFDALNAIFAGEEPNMIFGDPPRKGGMFRAECGMTLQLSKVSSFRWTLTLYRCRCTMRALELVQQYLEHVEEQEREYEPE